MDLIGEGILLRFSIGFSFAVAIQAEPLSSTCVSFQVNQVPIARSGGGKERNEQRKEMSQSFVPLARARSPGSHAGRQLLGV